MDLRIQQPDDYPAMKIDVDRTKAEQGGYSFRDIGGSLVNILSGSSQLSPMFYLNPKNGVVYSIVAEAPQYTIQSMNDLDNIPLASSTAVKPEILADVATVSRTTEMPIVTHYNVRRTLDIYGNVQGRDLGSVSRAINEVVAKHRKELPEGSFVTVRGQVETMKASYIGLIGGLAFAIVLVYLLIVVNFQSWLDPFIIITALPAALAGIVLFLFTTGTTLSVPALMGAIMCMGVATANSILVISFAKSRYERTSRCDPGRDRGRRDALPAGDDDGAGDDHRDDPDGAGTGRRRGAECAAGQGGDRRADGGDAGHPHLCSVCLRAAAWGQEAANRNITQWKRRPTTCGGWSLGP